MESLKDKLKKAGMTTSADKIKEAAEGKEEHLEAMSIFDTDKEKSLPSKAEEEIWEHFLADEKIEKEDE